MHKETRLTFTSDYMEGAHPEILKRLMETNLEKSVGYGLDEYSESAREKVRAACESPDADVYFLVGGTQANATMVDALLRPYQGVMAAKTGHISGHEAGAIEFGGHKVLELPHHDGKLSASDIRDCINRYKQDDNRDHTVMPGMVYISQPTEYGTLYSSNELKEISDICRENHIPLYMDGARLAYALACPENDVTLPDIAKLCDVFYIGGTKCGALFGEAVVIPKHDFIPHLFTIIKQHGALLAKGRIAAIQFETLFTDDLYGKIGVTAIKAADKIRKALKDKGYSSPILAPTNQIFVLLTDEKAAELREKVELGFWEKPDAEHTVLRIVTSWATKDEDVERLIEIL
ncbi:threonine aldolase family protein [Oribacterium sp. WCC10]|uniref:threonine aldolase family protein n=1 Tax=Oribacterium sp. WCC10 TaxID=1855343 RepID=UPI0008EFC8B4|nr:beta-eliminating lyase-related protein [Oribacterium sp. WCC10]SFG38275.1 L-threonine aldolase [Oribacterium sp. WCC10]